MNKPTTWFLIILLGMSVFAPFLVGTKALDISSTQNLFKIFVYLSPDDWPVKAKGVLPLFKFSAIEPQFDRILISPQARAWLGTDEMGRDLLARLITGWRSSCYISLAAALFGVLFGGVLGVFAAVLGGGINKGVQALILWFSTLPTYFLILLFLTVMPHSVFGLILVLVLVTFADVARYIYAQTKILLAENYILASLVLGASLWRIIGVHLTKALRPVLAVLVLQVFATTLLLEASLSYFGIGLPAHVPSLGKILFEAREVSTMAPWLLVVPGLFLGLVLFLARQWRKYLLN